MERTKVVIGDRNIFAFYNKEIKDIDTSKPLIFHEIFPKTLYKVAFKDEKLKNEFNAGLKKLKDNGKYDAIIKKFSLGN